MPLLNLCTNNVSASRFAKWTVQSVEAKVAKGPALDTAGNTMSGAVYSQTNTVRHGMRAAIVVVATVRCGRGRVDSVRRGETNAPTVATVSSASFMVLCCACAKGWCSELMIAPLSRVTIAALADCRSGSVSSRRHPRLGLRTLAWPEVCNSCKNVLCLAQIGSALNSAAPSCRADHAAAASYL